MVLDGMYYSGVYHLMAPKTAGSGVVFMLHRVRPAPTDGGFAPNRILEITPRFLDDVLARLRRRRIDVVTLDEAVRRLGDPSAKRFAAFTFDDGYADNLETALPVFEKHGAPFTVYVATGLLDGTADIWWLILEQAIGGLERVRTRIGEAAFDLPARTSAEKQAAWDAIYWPLRDLTIPGRRAVVDALADEAGVGGHHVYGKVALTWDQVRAHAAHPLVEFGAHTIDHFPLRALDAGTARHEIHEGRNRLEAKLGRPVRHFAYPYGDPESAGARDFEMAHDEGFATAVTTRPGPLFPRHAEKLHALPRVSLNGNYQSLRYVDLFLSGAPFALWNRAKKSGPD
jgi:peptidoglycan/xylan/chitin deacetylase (PgdA/CDA1 family)